MKKSLYYILAIILITFAAQNSAKADDLDAKAEAIYNEMQRNLAEQARNVDFSEMNKMLNVGNHPKFDEIDKLYDAYNKIQKDIMDEVFEKNNISSSSVKTMNSTKSEKISQQIGEQINNNEQMKGIISEVKSKLQEVQDLGLKYLPKTLRNKRIEDITSAAGIGGNVPSNVNTNFMAGNKKEIIQSIKQSLINKQKAQPLN